MPPRPKQEPRPAYHRRQDLARLQTLAQGLPLVVWDDGRAYVVSWPSSGDTPLQRGRYEVVAAYLTGWRHAWPASRQQAITDAIAEFAGYDSAWHPVDRLLKLREPL